MLEGDPHPIPSIVWGNSNHISSLVHRYLTIACRLFSVPVEITEQVNTVNGSKSMGHSVFPQESQRNLHLKLLNELLKSAPCPEEGKGV